MIGAYVATHSNPLFLRAALLQLAFQDTHVGAIAIHDNGHEHSFEPAVDDVLRSFLDQGTKVVYRHTPQRLTQPLWQLSAIVDLLELGATEFVKIDDDDVYYRNHVRVMTAFLIECDRDWVINRFADVYLTPRKSPTQKLKRVDCTGISGFGAPGSSVFSRRFAQQLVLDMRANIGLPDDVVMHKVTEPKFSRLVRDGDPTTSYIVHGNNTSTSHWLRDLEACYGR